MYPVEYINKSGYYSTGYILLCKVFVNSLKDVVENMAQLGETLVSSVIPEEAKKHFRHACREMEIEANRSNHFRVYDNKLDAEKWILE